jgi:hypothetical protein
LEGAVDGGAGAVDDASHVGLALKVVSQEDDVAGLTELAGGAVTVIVFERLAIASA